MPVDSAATAMPALASGDLLGRWALEHCVSDGLPRLYQAHRDDDPRSRALVTVLPKQASYVDRLRREAGVLRLLEHKALPELIDFGLSREHSVVWMATVDFAGETLQDRLLAGPLPWKEACNLFVQIASGLQHAHEHSIVHRDVHPAKILMGNKGRARLGGFESAITEGELERLAEVPLGPLGYLAPEVITEGQEIGPRADLYALGVVFFEALTGRSAFPAALVAERVDPRDHMIDWKARSKPLRPSGDMPDWLKNLVEQATHPDPRQRLPDLQAMVSWLEAARTAWEEPEAPPPRIVVPPPIAVMPTPSIKPAPAREPIAAPPPVMAPALLPMHYMAAAALGMTAGMLFSVLVILMAELPAL